MRSAALGLCCLLVVGGPAAAADVNWGAARWVWDSPNAAEQSPENAPRYFRKTFDLADKPAEAKLSLSADNEYVVYVNGQKVGEDGSWNEAETYDVARLLAAGKNCVAIRAANQGGPAGLICVLRVKVGGKETIAAATDATWRCVPVELAGWQQANYDEAAARAKWGPAAVLGDATIGPWNLAGAASGGNPTTSTTSKITSYRPAAEEQTHFTLPEGYQIELVAAEPLIINPVAIALDDQGRLYVSESHSYRFGPSGSPLKPVSTNPIVRLDPGPDGKLTRTLVAEGFDDPVMGLLVRGNQLFAAANNYLFRFDLDAAGQATNKTQLLVDKNKAWNPFGMFVLEEGLDGLIYLSVGNHNIDLQGPNGSLSGRGNSGIVCRFRPDGTNLERLVHGLRVPYSFDVDPYGQMWLLSNGEGNPNRFLRVLEGVDYHCYSRNVDYDWLAGRHPLAPPCFELPRGAHTQLVRYYGANFPAEMTGSLLLDNWGAHGFNGGNRSIFRYVPDERNNIGVKEAFLSCSDPHFRCSHVLLAPDGELLIADWYGRDDESDLTGRIWKVSHTGPAAETAFALDAPAWKTDPGYAHAALGAASHLVRKKAMETLVARGNEAVAGLASLLGGKRDSFAAAHALWTLFRIDTPEARQALALGGANDDWRVRRLALGLLRRSDPAAAAALAGKLAADRDPAVQVAAGLAHTDPAQAVATLTAALANGAADDEHLRYEAAWHIARHAGGEGPFAQLLASDQENVRLAGHIALDVALYEGFAGSKSAAQKALAGLLSDPRRTEFDLALTLAKLNPDPALTLALESLALRTDVPPAVTARALLLLRGGLGGGKTPLNPAIAARFLAAIDQGTVKLASAADQMTHMDLLAAEGATERALNYLARYATGNSPEVKRTALARLRQFGPQAGAVAPLLWSRLQAAGANEREERLQLVGALAEIESEPARAAWERLLSDKDLAVRIDAVRTWRAFQGRAEFVAALQSAAPTLVDLAPAVKEDLQFVTQRLAGRPAPPPLDAAGKEQLYRDLLGVLAAAAKLPAAEQQQMAQLGRRVFERSGCTKCHTTATADSPLAPSLRNVGQGLKHEGLVEAILFPSKVIKTGFLPETITTLDGQVVSGLVKDEGQQLRVLSAERETVVRKADIDRREVQKLSIMPEGQEQLFTRDEFRDLLLYLLSLK